MSATTSILTSTAASAPTPSSLTTLISQFGSDSDPPSALTSQVVHNLQHQHLWTSLHVHKIESASSTPQSSALSSAPFLISGIPPHRIYIHPDEQLYMLENGLQEDDFLPERVFILPATTIQTWSLRKLAAVFDSLPEPEVIDNGNEDAEGNEHTEKAARLTKYYERRKTANGSKEWGGKRLLLGIVDRGMGGDGTVVYYIVQEGNVKPRQN